MGGLPGKPIELTVGGLDRAIISVPDVAGPILTVSMMASGGQGRVCVVSAEGRRMEFQSLVAFHECQARVVRQLRESPTEFSQWWSVMVEARADSSASASFGTRDIGIGSSNSSSTRSTTVSVNGKTVSITESSDSGITVMISETVAGKEQKTVVKAANAEELKRKSPDADAYRLYDRHLGS